MARADEATFLWGYKSELLRWLRGFGMFSQCLTSFQPLPMTETTLESRVHKLLLQNPLHIIHHLRGGFLDIERFEFLMGNTKDNRGIGRAIWCLFRWQHINAVFVLHLFWIGPWIIYLHRYIKRLQFLININDTGIADIGAVFFKGKA